ncbi:MAG: hypothetical protein GY937_20420 [bacterium]|nr:hypothetical protein [bacterium]
MGRAEGLTEKEILGVSMAEECDSFSELEKLALDYAVALSDTPADVSDELFEALRSRLNEAQLIELTATVAWENFLARFNRGFAVEAEGFSEGAVCPIPDHRQHPHSP